MSDNIMEVNGLIIGPRMWISKVEEVESLQARLKEAVKENKALRDLLDKTALRLAGTRGTLSGAETENKSLRSSLERAEKENKALKARVWHLDDLIVQKELDAVRKKLAGRGAEEELERARKDTKDAESKIAMEIWQALHDGCENAEHFICGWIQDRGLWNKK